MESESFNFNLYERTFYQSSFEDNDRYYNIFYRFVYRSFKNKFHSYFTNVEDYEDVLQETLFNIFEKISSGKYPFKTTQEFYNTAFTSFKNAAIDFLKRESSHQKKMTDFRNSLLFHIAYEEDQEIASDLSRAIDLFNEIDQKLARNPRFMKGKMRKFYEAFKIGIISFNKKDLVREFVTTTLEIDHGYYSTLKNSFIKKIKDSNGSTYFI